jgi:AraC-like DNA-binding protein
MEIDSNGRRRDNDMDWDFPVRIQRSEFQEQGPIFASHWHEHFQIMYFQQGEAFIHCNSRPIRVGPGELIVINSKDVHYGENLCQRLVYYSVKVDLAFLFSNQLDVCQIKYLLPLEQNQILFQNQVGHDNELLTLMNQIISEYQEQQTGYELAVKASIYHMLVLLLRNHWQQTIDETQEERKRLAVHRILPVLDYVEHNYHEKITLKQLADMANMSSHHFCRSFKKITGKPPNEYINYLRISQAIILLRESNFNISEIAMTVGFNDSNYFCRLFKKYKQVSPSEIRKKDLLLQKDFST